MRTGMLIDYCHSATRYCIRGNIEGGNLSQSVLKYLLVHHPDYI
jgi:hypothetical protein